MELEEFEQLELLRGLAYDYDAKLTIDYYGDKRMCKIKFIAGQELGVKMKETGKSLNKTSEMLLDRVREELSNKTNG